MVRTLADLVTKSPESEVLGVLEAERETINALTNAGGEKGRWRYFSFTNLCTYQTGSPGGPGGKHPPASAEGAGSIPGSGRPLEKEAAAHSSTLAWSVPWTEEPGGLQFMGSHRAGHDLVTERCSK